MNVRFSKQKEVKRTCFVDPAELFPQATYYVNPNLKRPSRRESWMETMSQDALAVSTELVQLTHPAEEDSEDPPSVIQDSLFDSTDRRALLASGEIFEAQTQYIDTGDTEVLDAVQATSEQAKTKFGAWDGVFVSCLLNIFGVIMFLRLSFVVGQAGIWLAIVIILLSSVVTTLTALSMSAMATNGKQGAGGAYYMISRSMGPSIGGAIGVLFSIGMSVAISLYIIGFCEAVIEVIGVVSGDYLNDIRMYGVILTTVLLAMCLVGVGWVIKLQFALLFILVIAMLSFFVGCFMPDRGNGILGSTGWGNGNFVNNFTPKYQSIGDGVNYDFFQVFGIFFPAATGIMAGANLSSDLRDPSHDIPVGTLAAIAVSTVVYCILAVFLGAIVTPEVLITDNFSMTKASVWGPLILAGIYAATLSSALTSLVGAPRILYSVACDDLIPMLSVFAKTNANGEPVNAYIFSFTIAIGCVLIGNLNIVAPLISMFFLGTYAFISFACFFLSISKTPGWRPAFKYYSRYTAFLGGLLCLLIMGSINPVYGIIAVVFGISVAAYIMYRNPDVNWGSAFSAREKYEANRRVLNLSTQITHVKNFQPSFLVLCGNPVKRRELIRYVHSLRRARGTFVFGHILVGKFEQFTQSLQSREHYLPSRKLIGYYDRVIAPSIREGARTLMQLSGLGGLKPNTLVLGFKSDWNAEQKKRQNDFFDLEDDDYAPTDRPYSNAQTQSTTEYVGVISDAIKMDMGIMVCRGLNRLDWGTQNGRMSGLSRLISLGGSSSSLQGTSAEDIFGELDDANFDSDLSANINLHDSEDVFSEDAMVDVWWLLDDGGLSLLVPHCMTLSKVWKSRWRLYLVYSDNDSCVGATAGERPSEDNGKDSERDPLSHSGREESLLGAGTEALGDDSPRESSKWESDIADLMGKFRMNCVGPIAIRTNRDEPGVETLQAFAQLCGLHSIGEIPQKAYRWLRVSELISSYSSEQKCVYVTAPNPNTFDDPNIFMGVLDMLSSANRFASVLIRGSGKNCLTFYSE